MNGRQIGKQEDFYITRNGVTKRAESRKEGIDTDVEQAAAFGVAVMKLLKSRERGPLVSTEKVRKQAEQVIKRRRKS